MASVYRKNEAWYYAFLDETGKWRNRKGLATERETRSLAMKLEREAERVRKGLVDPDERRRLERLHTSLESLADQHKAWILSNGRTARHADRCHKVVREAVQNIGWTTVADVNREGIDRYLQVRRTSGWSSAYYNGVKAMLHGFFERLVELDYLAKNPTRGMRQLLVGASQNQRVMTQAEFAAIMNCDAIPLRRRVFYRLKLRTGLRTNEVRVLTWTQFDLDSDQPALDLSPEGTKSRRADVLPLTQDLAAALRAVRPTKAIGSIRVFRNPPARRTWLRDLGRAGVEFETQDGRLTMQSMRATVGTWMAEADVPITKAAKLLRHKDPKTTLKHYTRRLRLTSLAPDAERLAAMIPDTRQKTSSISLAVGCSVLPQTADTDQTRESSSRPQVFVIAGESEKPPRGLEPLTCALRMRRSTS